MKESIYIVGGGPSLKGFPFAQLKDKDTIAVNMSAFDVPNPTYCITADSNIFRRLQEGYFDEVFTTWVVIAHPEHCAMKFRDGRYKNTKSGFVYNPFCTDVLIKNAGVEGIGFAFSDFRTGYNSGFCALQFAVLLGYKKIYLLGIDLIAKPQTHYHERYGGRPTITAETFDKFYKNFVVALRTIKQETDIKVISCSPISTLNGIISYEPFGKERNGATF